MERTLLLWMTVTIAPPFLARWAANANAVDAILFDATEVILLVASAIIFPCASVKDRSSLTYYH